jgi:hypothetical protein
MVIFPSENGFNVLVWGEWTTCSMRVRRFDNRAEMIATLQNLHFITPQQASELEDLGFVDSCPMFSAQIDEERLIAHGFGITSTS